jgi:hypothetical protein
MTRFRLLSVFFFAIVITSCDMINVDRPKSDETIVINNNPQRLANRIQREGAGVIRVTPSDRRSSKLSTQDTEEAGDQPLSRIASVTPPSYGGKLLTASHVYLDGSFAYIAYNRMGPDYLGAVEILDIRDVNSPKLLSQVIFTTMDVSAVFVRDGFVYIAGARDRDKFDDVATSAFVARMELNGTSFTKNMDILTLPGYVATDITADATRLFVTSGNDGQMSVVNVENMAIVASVKGSDLRSVAIQDNHIAFLSGIDGATLFNASTLEKTNTISIPTDSPDAKRTMQFYENSLMIAEGVNGAGIYNAETSELIQRLAIERHPDDVDPSDVVTNAVSATNGLVWMANGGAGLSVTRIDESGKFTSLGIAELGGSCNYIQSEGNYIFAAAGAAGLHILHREDAKPEDVIACEGAVPYNGGSWLNVNSGQNLAYSGAASVQGVNVNALLSFCGSLSIQEQLNLNSNSTFNMKGSLSFGRYGSSTTLHINSGAKLRVEGSLVIWGNLNLNSGATIEFVGSGSSLAVYGKVTKGQNVTISGTFTDAFGSLK